MRSWRGSTSDTASAWCPNLPTPSATSWSPQRTSCRRKKICGSIYRLNCSDCSDFYIGESGRQLGTRLVEHQKSFKDGNFKSAVSEHAIKHSHRVDFSSASILDREDRLLHRKVKEAIWIRQEKPPINRDQGYPLPHLYDRALWGPQQTLQ